MFNFLTEFHEIASFGNTMSLEAHALIQALCGVILENLQANTIRNH